MKIPAPPMSILFTILLLSFTPFLTSSTSDSDLLTELKSIQSRSPSNVIHLNDNLLRRIISTKPRSFSLILFFDAIQLHDKSELHLKSLKSEFNLLSNSFTLNNQDSPATLSKLFFADIEFGESQSSFAQFGVNALPHIRLLPPNAVSLKSDSIQMDAGDFSRLAESMSEFIESKTKISIGHIHRPPIVSKTQIGFILIAFLISLPFLIKRALAGETMLHDKKIWLMGSVFVYFFSVSGTMHNIIRKMPMFISDRNDPNKLVFFYQGSGMQLGAEGFAIGFLYTIVGLLLAFVTHVLVRVKSKTAQRAIMILAMIVSVWAVRKVVFLDNWKTGYAVHAYLPSSW
uniref:probable dolichyl-diphosphooligosaccharide--protein glycosyltransferase subunit 3B n=1 Tax=Erigeron canadensis TaxID=72917 RepID=UPI001CB895F1|nr:probable dolichyl-diphosphooligosaccharide--protein glycosyltransferase subunit 3B [Erigeron canadensis]